jgi:hypothetical protein
LFFLFQIPSHDRLYLKDYTRGEAYEKQLQVEDLQCERPPEAIQDDLHDNYSAEDQKHVKASTAERTKKKKELRQKQREGINATDLTLTTEPSGNEAGTSYLTGEKSKSQKRPPPELIPFESPEVTVPLKKQKLDPKSAVEQQKRLAVQTAENDMEIDHLLASVDRLEANAGEASIVDELQC